MTGQCYICGSSAIKERGIDGKKVCRYHEYACPTHDSDPCPCDAGISGITADGLEIGEPGSRVASGLPAYNRESYFR